MLKTAPKKGSETVAIVHDDYQFWTRDQFRTVKLDPSVDARAALFSYPAVSLHWVSDFDLARMFNTSTFTRPDNEWASALLVQLYPMTSLQSGPCGLVVALYLHKCIEPGPFTAEALHRMIGDGVGSNSQKVTATDFYVNLVEIAEEDYRIGVLGC